MPKATSIEAAYRALFKSPHGAIVLADLIQRHITIRIGNIDPTSIIQAQARKDLIVEILELSGSNLTNAVIDAMEEL